MCAQVDYTVVAPRPNLIRHITRHARLGLRHMLAGMGAGSLASRSVSGETDPNRAAVPQHVVDAGSSAVLGEGAKMPTELATLASSQCDPCGGCGGYSASAGAAPGTRTEEIRLFAIAAEAVGAVSALPARLLPAGIVRPVPWYPQPSTWVRWAEEEQPYWPRETAVPSEGRPRHRTLRRPARWIAARTVVSA